VRSKILAVLVVVVAVTGASSTAMARGGSGGMAMHSGGMAMHGHGHFDHRFRFVNRFNKNPLFLSGWGWGDWGWGGYGDSGYGGNTTVVVFPQAVPQAAKGDPAPCNWHQQEFTVQSSAGGTRPVQVVSCH
jgi:hypothetical protein